MTRAAPGIVVEPATADRYDDILRALRVTPPSHCTCQYWRMTSSEYSRSSQGDRLAALRRQTEEDPPPGMLAYIDGEPVGWCGFGIRQRLGRLVRSRTIPWPDDRPVWSVFCFVVRPGFRRRGVAHALLEAAIGYAAEHGAPALEAYPIDPEGRRVNTTDAYVGTVGLFEAHGFHRVMETAATSARLPRLLMRRDL